MKIRIPNFIPSECMRLAAALPPEHKQEAETIYQQLCKMNRLEDAVCMMADMAKLETYVSSHLTPQLFKRSHISNSLYKGLSKKKVKENAANILDVVQKMSRFEMSLGKGDEKCEWDRTFNGVTSPTEWRRICARTEVFPLTGSIQVALEIKYPRQTITCDKAWKSAIQKLSMYNLAELYYEILLRQVPRAIYYIYLR